MYLGYPHVDITDISIDTITGLGMHNIQSALDIGGDIDSLYQDMRDFGIHTNSNSIIEDFLTKKYFKEVLYYIMEHRDTKIHIGNTEVNIYGNNQILYGILNHINRNMDGLDDIKDAIQSYEYTLNQYIETETQIDTVIYLGAGLYHGEDPNKAFANVLPGLKHRFPDIDIQDYSGGTELGKTISTPNDFIETIQSILQEHEDQNIYLEIALHGWEDGSALFRGGNFQREHFEAIRDISNQYPNLKIVISSCYSIFKLDSNEDGIISNEELGDGNILLTSGNNAATSKYDTIIREAFTRDENGNLRGDLTGDGRVSWQEAMLYKKIHYQDSVLISSSSWFKNNSGEQVEITPEVTHIGSSFLDNH